MNWTEIAVEAVEVWCALQNEMRCALWTAEMHLDDSALEKLTRDLDVAQETVKAALEWAP